MIPSLTATVREFIEAHTAQCGSEIVACSSPTLGGWQSLADTLDALSQPKDAVGGGVPAGMVLVPREPTEAMREVGGQAAFDADSHGDHWLARAGAAWSAMIDAAPKAASSYDGDARERIADVIELHLTQAVFAKRVDGYTLPLSKEIADAILAALPTSDASERLREARIANPVVVVDHVTHERGTEMWSEVITDRAHNNQVAHCADKEDAELIAHLINAALSNNEVSDDKCGIM